MKTIYETPKVTVVAFKVEEAFASVYNSAAGDGIVLFDFFEMDNDNSNFGNDQFTNIADENSNYNFFGD